MDAVLDEERGWCELSVPPMSLLVFRHWMLADLSIEPFDFIAQARCRRTVPAGAGTRHGDRHPRVHLCVLGRGNPRQDAPDRVWVLAGVALLASGSRRHSVPLGTVIDDSSFRFLPCAGDSW
ncbi:MAG: hypothetical protein J4F97_03310 [Pseudomonadales bacterium]|nr:hypothetical protein [Pseudomonadales bacterium]